MGKRKLTILSLKTKNELLDELERGVPVVELVAKYGVAKQTISDIKKKKEEIRAFNKVASSCTDPSFSKMRLKSGHYSKVEEATVKWFMQQESVGVSVRSFELKNAAFRLAKQMGVKGFTASDGWLHRFRRRHCLFSKRAHGESGSAKVSDIDPFRTELNKLIADEGLLMSQVYNMDETGLFWRSLPVSTHVMGRVTKAKGRKLDKTRISILCGANADGSHRLTPVVVGKSARPRCLKDVMHKLTCHYYNSINAWFTAGIFETCFYKNIVPEIVAYQRDILHIPEDRIRALILLDNAPAHPSKEKLIGHKGKIRVMYLPANTTSLIQPMDQGVIHAVKLGYRRLFLSEVMVVEETADDEEEGDTRGLRTLDNLKAYNLKQAIFNFGEAWNQVKVSTLANAWKRLLFDVDAPVVDFEGFEVSDFEKMFKTSGERAGEEDVRDWLEMDEGDPGHHLLTDTEIIEAVNNEGEVIDDDSDDDDEVTTFSLKLSTARDYLDQLIQFVDTKSREFSLDDYHSLRSVRRKVIDMQHATGKQTKISSFFRSRTPTPNPTPVQSPEPQPSTSGSRVSPPPTPQPLSDSE